MINISVLFRWMLMKHTKLLYHVLLRWLFLVSLLAFNSACMEYCFLNNCLQPGLPVRGKSLQHLPYTNSTRERCQGKSCCRVLFPAVILHHFEWLKTTWIRFQLKLIWLDAIQHKVMVSWLQYKLMLYVFLSL